MLRGKDIVLLPTLRIDKVESDRQYVSDAIFVELCIMCVTDCSLLLNYDISVKKYLKVALAGVKIKFNLPVFR